MTERLTFEQHQTARRLADIAARKALPGPHADRAAQALQDFIRRDHAELGTRYVCPSGQTVERFADALAVWKAA